MNSSQCDAAPIVPLPPTLIHFLPVGNSLVPDSTHKMILHGGSMGSYFALLSPERFPETVAQALDAQRQFQMSVSPRVASVIEPPCAAGNLDGRSYALWRLRRPLSNRRWLRGIQRRRLIPHVLRWLHDLAECGTVPDQSIDHYAEPLAVLAKYEGLPQQIRDICLEAHSDFCLGHIPPVSLPNHGDLWFGNIIIPTASRGVTPNYYGFLIVDWGSATPHGVPFFDLFKFAESAGLSPTACRAEIEKHAHTLQVAPTTSLSYLLVGLARLWQRRGQMPESTFRRLCRNQFNFVRAALQLG